MANITKINGKDVKDSTAVHMASLATIEANTTATTAHEIGSYFWLNEILYETITTIAVGDTITVGTNCKAAILGDDVANLKSQMGSKASTDMALGAYPADTVSGGVASFSDGADSIPVKDLVIGIEPVQSGSGDPSPDNVRLISGWTGANVARSGKNLCNPDAIITNAFIRAANPYESSPIGSVVNGIGANGVKCTDYIKVEAQTKYTTCVPKYKSMVSAGLVFFSGKSVDDAISGVPTSAQNGGVYTFITPANCEYIRFTWWYGDGGTEYPEYPNPMLVMGTDTTYEPYVGTTYPITFPSEAGTVYGGTLDVTTGVLTVDRELITLDGIVYKITGAWGDTQYGSALYFTTIGNRTRFLPTTSNVLQYSYTGYPAMPLYSFPGTSGSSATCTIVLPTGTTKDQGNQWLQDMILAGTPVQVMRLLASVVTYQLDPIEVLTLLGTNTIYADTGGTTVNYRADPALYIQRINTPTDDDMTADAQITSGKYFVIGNTLYKATTTIPAGDTINPGTNCVITNLAEALNALNA